MFLFPPPDLFPAIKIMANGSNGTPGDYSKVIFQGPIFHFHDYGRKSTTVDGRNPANHLR